MSTLWNLFSFLENHLAPGCNGLTRQQTPNALFSALFASLRLIDWPASFANRGSLPDARPAPLRTPHSALLGFISGKSR
jgi:hypothetical protein